MDPTFVDPIKFFCDMPLLKKNILHWFKCSHISHCHSWGHYSHILHWSSVCFLWIYLFNSAENNISPCKNQSFFNLHSSSDCVFLICYDCWIFIYDSKKPFYSNCGCGCCMPLYTFAPSSKSHYLQFKEQGYTKICVENIHQIKASPTVVANILCKELITA